MKRCGLEHVDLGLKEDGMTFASPGPKKAICTTFDNWSGFFWGLRFPLGTGQAPA